MRVLGLVFDLSELPTTGVIKIRHTSDRAEEPANTFDEILKKGTLSAKDAEMLRGRLHWYNSCLFGRAPAIAMKALAKRATASSRFQQLDQHLCSSLETLKSHVLHGRPLELSANSCRTYLCFTDGSFEHEPSPVAAVGVSSMTVRDT